VVITRRIGISLQLQNIGRVWKCAMMDLPGSCPIWDNVTEIMRAATAINTR
jgi:hypothetical protein